MSSFISIGETPAKKMNGNCWWTDQPTAAKQYALPYYYFRLN